METRQIHVRDLSTVTGIQQFEHEVQSIYFLGLEDFVGTIYLSMESDKYSNEAVPLTSNTFIIGQPMTIYNTTYTCQIYGVLNNGEKIQLSKRFRLIVDKSNDIQGDSEEYPVDPNFTNGIIEFMDEQKEQAKSEIEATGEAVKTSIPSDYTALEQATYNAYPVQSENGNPIYFDDGADDIPVKELIVSLEPKQSGTGDPSPSNVRPISGYGGVTIKRDGKNFLADLITESQTANGITIVPNSDGTFVVNGTSTSSASRDFRLSGTGIYRLDLPVGEYCLNGGVDGLNGTWNTLYIGIQGGSSRYIGVKDSDMTFTIADGEYISNVFVRIASGATANGAVFKPMIRLASTTDSTFEPYQGQKYSITFPSNVGTVYGGTLNVTTGLLTIDRAIATITSVSQMKKGGSTSFDEFYMKSPSPWGEIGTLYGADNIVCSHAPSLRSGSTTQVFTRLSAGQPRIVFPLSEGINSLSAFETWLNGQSNPLQFAYRIAEPLTYQLTPTEVSTLLGSNTITSDGSMGLTYRADTTKVIEKLTNAIISLGGNV